jgi:hypothetical protein
VLVMVVCVYNDNMTGGVRCSTLLQRMLQVACARYSEEHCYRGESEYCIESDVWIDVSKLSVSLGVSAGGLKKFGS